MLDMPERASSVHMRVVDHLVDLPDRGIGNAVGLQQTGQVFLLETGRPVRDQLVDRLDMADARAEVDEAFVSLQVLASHRVKQGLPMFVGRANQGEPTVLRRVDVVWRFSQTAMAVAGTWRVLSAGPEVKAEGRAEGRVDGLEHRDFDNPALAGALPREEGGHDRAVEMDPTEEVADRRPAFHRRTIGISGRRHGARHRLHRQVHGEKIAVGPERAIARPRGVDELRVDLQQGFGPDPEAVHGSGREVLQQDIGARHHLAQDRQAPLTLQVERHELFVRVEHGEREHRAADSAAPTHLLAFGRLDLDDAGSGHRHQEGRVGPVIDLAQIDDGHTGKRPLR